MVGKTIFLMPCPTKSNAGDWNIKSKQIKCPKVTLKSVANVLISAVFGLVIPSSPNKLNLRYLKINWIIWMNLITPVRWQCYVEITFPFRSNTTFVLYRIHSLAQSSSFSWSSSISRSFVQFLFIYKLTTTYFWRSWVAQAMFRKFCSYELSVHRSMSSVSLGTMTAVAREFKVASGNTIMSTAAASGEYIILMYVSAFWSNSWISDVDEFPLLTRYSTTPATYVNDSGVDL